MFPYMVSISIQEGASETLEDEMGLTGATAEDAEAEYIKKICDHEIVTGMRHWVLRLSP